MAKLEADAEKYLKRALGKGAKVLLINPPVEERRYHWLRWNQPLDLLKLSTWMKRANSSLDVRLYDFMLPDASGAVHKHKVKDTWAGDELSLWHFGRPLESFSTTFHSWMAAKWVPDVIIITSLTSYWHRSIRKLLVDINQLLGRTHGKRTKKVLYGYYPRFEAAHAESQAVADVALTSSPNLQGCAPDLELYLAAEKRLPEFFALDIEDPKVADHLKYCHELHVKVQRKRGVPVSRLQPFTSAFFNEDVCSPSSQLAEVVAFAQSHEGAVRFEGISGIVPRSLTRDRLLELKASGFETLFVEHARTAGGGPDMAAYEPLFELAHAERAQRSLGEAAWMTGSVSGFVNIGLPDDDIDELVRSTLVLNSNLGAIILKPHGYSPDIDAADEHLRRQRWREPRESAAQWFPYVGHGSKLTRDDYDNLIRWQNVINKRVKGASFDFLDSGNVARLVRETLVAESWKPHSETR